MAENIILRCINILNIWKDYSSAQNREATMEVDFINAKYVIRKSYYEDNFSYIL